MNIVFLDSSLCFCFYSLIVSLGTLFTVELLKSEKYFCIL